MRPNFSRMIFQTLALAVSLSFIMNTTLEAQTERAVSNAMQPPVAKKIPKTTRIHGDTLVDDYYWLREKTNPEVISYLEAENRYTEEVMRPTEALQKTLYDEILGRIKQTDLSVPYRFGDYFYYSRTEEGKQYQILCRKRGSLEAKEEITLDLNELARGHKFLGLGAYSVSDDGNLLAYSTDITGFRQYTLYVKDLRTGELLPDRVEKTLGAVWAADNKTLFYGTEDAAKRPYRIYRHAVGTKGGDKEDALIYEEKDELYRAIVTRTRDRKYILIGSVSSETSEWRYIPTDKPSAVATVILPRENEHEYYVDHHEGSFYILTNEKAKNFRLVHAPVGDPSRKSWREVVAYRPTVKLENVSFFKNHFVVAERENALQYLNVTEINNGRVGKSYRVEMPEPVYTVFGDANPEYNTDIFRFQYQSFITPSSVYDFNMKTRERKLLKQTEVLGGYDANSYASERIYATAADGARIPMSLVYKKGMKRDGTTPLLLYAYGSYGISQQPTFSSPRLSLLNRGVAYAVAHIRGGGDMGEEWHDTGKMMLKKNTFTDFISCAEHLVKEKYTSSDRLVIQGGSAGGLLMGAVTNMRPNLFKAVVSLVPFVDVINTMLDSSLPLTVGEYLEWGNPNDEAAYRYMKSYSPYDNIERKNYPPILVRTSLNDSQVMYWEPAKYVAKVRVMKTDSNPLLFRINMGAGHGGSSGRYDALREVAFDYAFILMQLGLAK